MYVPSHFAEKNAEAVSRFLRTYPLCSLVTSGADGMFASHLPMILDPSAGEHGTLRGHLARANPHWRFGHKEALAIFMGVDAYVSPSLYPSKLEHGRVVPTWNYQAIQVSGTITFIDDAVFVKRTVEELTTLMESQREKPWKVSDAPEDYLEKMLHADVGVELRIREIQAKWKLSQNRSATDFEGVRQGLTESENPHARQTAQAMQSLRK